MIISVRQLARVTPLLEAVLSRITGGRASPQSPSAEPFPILVAHTENECLNRSPGRV